MMEIDSEYSESSTITFEWTVRGLKNLFDSTKGDKKSKVTKSARFGNDRWQILFYANAGQTKDGAESGGYVSLYLSCEPTAEEKEAALADSGRWVRNGIYKFCFELKNLEKTVLYNSKEAHNHTFTYKTANWGWAQFARRDSVYYQSSAIRSQDAFVVICTITSSPSPPPLRTLPPRQQVPKSLLDTVGELLDDPAYSDVQFIVPKRDQSITNGRRIWASKRLLQRAEYFQTMFSSNFAEGSLGTIDLALTPQGSQQDTRQLSSIIDVFEDSDYEDDMDETKRDSFHSTGIDESMVFLPDSHLEDSERMDHEGSETSASRELAATSAPVPRQGDDSQGQNKMTIVVRDAAYTTYRAMLYYLYTDNIVFAPLSSSFHSKPNDPTATPADSLPSTPSEGGQLPGAIRRFSHRDHLSSRAEWIRDWMRVNPGRPAPCSAKSIYRLADRLDLPELKERAAQHIMKSLTVDNIGYEVFSPFAAAFDAIRKVEVDFFLSHWHEIRSSETMKNVWLQIRNGRHPGFEDVWPLIAQRLEFKPSTPSSPSAGKPGD